MTVPGGLFRIRTGGKKKVYLTFDDGPIPEITPWVLDVLDHYDIKATFFMVGQNVERWPELLEEVRRRGHSVGNHTLHHLNGAGVTTKRYLLDVKRADSLIGSDLFRPPHGWLRIRQTIALRRKFRIVMYDLVTRDYSNQLTWQDVFENVKRYTRPGSIIVFHDSLKSISRLERALPATLEWLKDNNYEFGVL